MHKTGYVYDPLFLKHTQPHHPESARRLEVILSRLEADDLLSAMQEIPVRQATPEELTSVHPEPFIRRVEDISRSGGGMLDPDTYANEFTYPAAVTAAGSLIELTLSVLDGRVNNGYALIRPPGHHATRTQSMGFCIFNNVALAAQVAHLVRRLERVAIVDFDVHHGNGTQDIFEEDAGVFYISTHQHPLYPGTGGLRETGRGKGKGYTLNLPLPAGVGDEGFNRLYREIIFPLLHRFQPQLLLISAGYDAHWNDPLSDMGLSLTGLARISQMLVEQAQTLCQGRIVFTLEGGYHPVALSIGVANSIKALLGRSDFLDPLGKATVPEPDLHDYLQEVKKIHRL